MSSPKTFTFADADNGLLIVELINIPAVIIFAVTHRFDDGLIYGQSFWMTVCSMVVSATTNIILIIDYIHTKHFIESGTLESVQRPSSDHCY